MNGKRILAAVLAAAMTASSFTIDAFADNIMPQNNVTDNSTENTVTAYTTNDEADDSVLAGSTVINCASLDELQSEHPYAENSDITYVYTDTSCNNLKITFSIDSSFEFIKDFLTIYDGDDNQIDKLGGNDLAGITVYVPGNTVKLRLTSDDSTCYYGFKVFSVENVDIMPTQGDPEYDYILKNISADDEAPVYYINKYKGAGGDIVIPSEIDGRKVSGISNGAFNGCTTVTNVAVSDGISNIDFNAFSNCPALKSVSLPKGVTTINSGAFCDCKNLTDITLPDGLAIIETLTFYGCSSLADITIPDSVTEIGYQAFFNCTSLKTVTVPASVGTIGKFAFGYYYDSETNEQKKIDGFKINYTKNTAGHLYAFENGFTDESCLVSQLQDDGTVQITQYLGSDISFAIPDEINGKKVTGIGKMAFQNCTSLTSITIPDSVTDIESYAFDGCTALTDIVLPDNVTSVGENAFYNCTSLKTATVPASVTSIGDYAFGYYNDGTGTKKIDGFKINYIKNTQGHIYAAINGFTDEACLFTELQDDGTLKISKYIGSDTVYVIPDEIDGKKVTSIGYNAFQKRTSLTSITIPDGVTDIEQYAFEGCTSLSDITLPDSLTSIGLSAFESCTALTDIALPDSLTYIGGLAFANCTSLKTVTVPASVTFIGGWAFGYYFEDGNIDARVAFDDFTINYTKHTAGHLYAIENGFTDEGCLKYTVSADGTLEISGYLGSDTVFEIPAEIGGKKVTKIRYNAFENRTSLTSVTIPDSVTDIGFQAFHNCTSLKSVTIPASVTTIGNYAFGYFYDANKETKIDGFKINYTKNTAGHLYAAQNGFTDEACLINELQDDGTVIITKYAGNDTVFEIPSEIDGKKVTGIGNRAFQNSTSLTNVTIPDGVTHIDECAFQGCSSLTDIALPDSLTIIDSYAFNNCAMLTSITIPNGVTRIEWETFYGCSALTDLVLPDTVTYIGRNAFFNCPSLKTVTIPAGVTDIGEYAFGYYYDNNYNITKTDGFKINYTKNTWGHYYAKQNGFSDEPCLVAELNEDGTTLKISKYAGNDTEYVIPEEIDGKKVTSIGNDAFFGNTSLISVTIPGSIKDIGNNAFSDCSSLESVTISDGVERILYRAFYNCTSLKTVTVPASVTYIDNNALGYYSDDGGININKIDGFTINYTKYTHGHLYATANGFTDEGYLYFNILDDDTVEIKRYIGNDTVYEIPAEIDGKQVTGITNYAFGNCSSLTSVTIPDSVTDIGFQAFHNCTSLKSVTIPASVTTIGDYAFGYFDDEYQKTKIDGFKINYTKNTAGHRYAFENGFTDETCLLTEIQEDGTVKITKYCGNDTSFVIPAEIDGKPVTSIGYRAFADSTLLTSITIPDSVKYIEMDAFASCTSLTDIVLPASLITIDTEAFRNCTSLTRVTIPDGVTDIGSYAFASCSALTKISLPDSVVVIGGRAFFDCPLLKSVTVPASVTDIGEYAFGYHYDDDWYYTKTDGFKINYTKNTAGHLYAVQNGFSDETCLLTEPHDDNSTLRITKYAGYDTEYVIPAEIDGKKISEIGYNAFENCTSLTSVTIPDGVTMIGSAAFRGCTALTDVVLPDSVMDIFTYAFMDCTSLKSVTIPASVRNIGNNAFGYYNDNGAEKKIDGFKINYTKNTWGHYYATVNGFSDEPCLVAELNEDGTTLRISKYVGNDTALVIPAEINGKKVTSIGNGAFNGNKLLTSVTIPDGVISIESFAFGSCTALTDVVLPDSITSIDGFAFDSCTSLSSVSIPAGVEYIGHRAFLNCTSLKSVTIPAGVKDIGEYAFGYYNGDNWDCLKTDGFRINYTKNTAGHYYAFKYGATDEACLVTKLKEDGTLKVTGYAGYDTEYVIPAEINGKKITEIGMTAFYECTSLTKVTIPDGITSIGVEAFNRCTSLTDIVLPDSLTNIGNGAFANCTSLKSVTIPAGVTNIGEYAFGYYYDDNFVFTKVDGFKINYTKNTEGHYYATENGFSDETCLITYVVENSDTLAIEKYTGHDKTYVIPSEIDGKKITRIDSYAFKNRTSLTSVTIPDGVTIIGAEAFFGCTALTDINIPDGVTRIGSYAFNECSALADIKIPDSVTAIGMGAFNDTAIFNNQDPTAKYVGKWLVYYDQTVTTASIKADTVGIADIAFHGCKIENIVIPDKVKYIGNNAFSSCSWLESVVIPDSVITIGEAAFLSCDSLASVSIPASVESIEKLAFGFSKYDQKYDNFKIEYVKQTEGHRYAAENGFTDEICFLTEELDNGSLRVIGYAGKASSVTIPAEINGKPVTELGDEEFRFNFRYSSALKSLTVPDSVIRINYKAFYDRNLTTVVLPEKLTDIGIGAFDVTPVIKKQKTDIKYIGSTVISCDTEAETLTIGDNVTTIASNAFVNGDDASNCGDLKSLIISRNVKYIGEHAFGYYLDEENNYRKVEDFAIKCYCNSAAEQYAKDNGIEYELIADGHNAVVDKAVEPTCTKTGLTEGSHCSICGATLIAQKTIPATGKHEFGDWTITKAATCTATGTKTKTCSVCGKTETATIAKTAHKYGNTVVKPTYTAKGYTLHKCSACGASYKDTYTAMLTLAKIGGFKVKAKDSTSITLQWNRNANASGYIIEAYNGKTWVQVTKIAKNSTLTYKVTKLSASKTYQYRIKAYKTEGKATAYSANSATLSVNTNPTNMSGYKVKSKTATSVTLQWNKNASATGYELQKWDGKKWVTLTKIAKNSTTTYTVKGLKASTTYKYRIRAYKTIGKATQYSAYSATLSVNTNPSNMSGYKVKSKTSTSVTLQWNKNASATGYELQKWDGKKWVTLTKISKNSTTTYTVKSLKASTTYKYKIRAYKTIGKTTQYSAYTATLSVNTNPSNMSGFKAKAKSYNSVTLQWNKNTSATGYELQKWDGKKWVTLTKISKNSTTTYTVKGLKASTTYKYKIRAYKTIGKTTQYSAYSATLSVNTNPTNMSGYKVKSKTATSVTLQWNKNTSATGYELQKWDGKKWVTLTKISKNSTTTYTVKGLKASTTYKYRIRAYKTIGKATQYSAYTATLSVNTNPSNMSGFKAKSTAKTLVTLQWNKNTSATGYEIQKWNGKKWVSAAKVTKNSTVTSTVKSLKKNTSYKFRIRAYKTIGKATQYSSWSGTLTVKTKK